MRIAFLNPQGNFDPLDSYLTEHPDFGGQLVYVKELSLAMAQMGIDVDIVTRRIDDPDWSGFSERVDYYEDCRDRLRILRIAFGGSRFIEKEKLWRHIPEFIDNLLKYYGGEPPDYLTGHYADGGYSCVLLQRNTGLGFTFTGHSLGAQKIDKLEMNAETFAGHEQRFHFAQRIDAERLAMQRADTVITSTEQERNEQYAHVLYDGAIDSTDDGRFAVVPPGVNTAIFNDAEQDEDREEHRWLAARTGGRGLRSLYPVRGSAQQGPPGAIRAGGRGPVCRIGQHPRVRSRGDEINTGADRRRRHSRPRRLLRYPVPTPAGRCVSLFWESRFGIRAEFLL